MLKWHKTGLEFEVLDGKQRLSTLLDFVRGEFTIFDGYYFRDLLQEDQLFLLRHGMTKTIYRKFDNSSLTFEEKVELFLKYNDLGNRVSENHLKTLRKVLK